ncbi:Protein GDAP2 [Orchesella cincta]|uniref:Protein GDAP2 n=1 Tax=Orchesella cincta TaxID=48709 RepID=A0A1D2MI61_ORCCI|nr:Protein GDAP2 [Orchesella cincta]
MRMMEHMNIDGSSDPEDSSGAMKWSEMDLSHVNLNQNLSSWPHHLSTRNFESSPFPVDPVLNSRVSLWFGDILALSVDGLTQTTNETVDTLPDHILTRSGPAYLSEIRHQLRSIRTGEARTVASHPNLPCRDLVLTVTPKYSEKHKTAAETALFSCYRSVLERACEKNMDCVAIPTLHKGGGPSPFPDELAAHVAIRTVRRWLEQGHSSPRLVILAVSDHNLFQLYTSLMVSYFPRDSLHENYACSRLSIPDIGDEEGAPWLPDRKIRIFSNPAGGGAHSKKGEESGANPSFAHHPKNLNLNLNGGSGSDDYAEEGEGIMEQLNKDFLQMKEDVDKERLIFNGRKRRSLASLNETERHIAIEIETKERQERILRRARTEDLSSIERTGCIFRNGIDRWGRHLVIVVGKWFRPEAVDLDKAFLYLVRILDEINGPYSVVYFHTSTGGENRPSLRWMRAVYDNMEYRFKKNLKSLLIVHPTMWTKVLCWWFTTFMAPAIKLKLHNIAGLEELYNTVEPSQIQVPAFISEHDITINGYAGVAYSHTHSAASTPVSS